MKINEASWIEIRKIIESSLVEDENITDVILNCKVRDINKSKNILTFNAIIK
jgi:hypothetical protein|tara:strand:+ start:439 stop:594 length:156 start_codon:yes stop_codon:yes gene_type:complete